MALSHDVRRALRDVIEEQMSIREAARRSGRGQSGVQRRLDGRTPMTIDDLEQLAAAVGYQPRVSLEPIPPQRAPTP